MKKLFFMFLVLGAINVNPNTTFAQTVKQETTKPAAIPAKYAGVYQLNENFKITVTVEKDKLYCLAPGDSDKSEFTAETGTKFFLKDTPAKIEFVEENGQFYLLVNMQGGLKLKKIS